MRVRLLALLVLTTASASPTPAGEPASSWLGLDAPAAPEAPLAAVTPSRDALGLTRPDPLPLLPYHHPFSAEAHHRLLEAGEAAPTRGGIYLIRSDPGPAGSKASAMFVAQMHASVSKHGFRVLATPPRGGVPHTPFMAIARYEGDDGAPLPAWLQWARVEGATVRLALLGLGANATQPSLEVPLLESDVLEPTAALARAAELLEEARVSYAPDQRLSRERIESLWPEASGHLADVPDPGLLLAVRVLWHSPASAEPIPGPGGVMVRAVVPRAAFPRLYALYTHGAR